MRPYPAYKDSGVEWLGEVPEGWEVKRLRRVVSLNPSKTEIAELDRLQEVSFIPMEAVGENGELDLSRSRPIGEVETGYTYFRDGDMTFAKITPCFENGKRALMRGLLGGVGFGTTELTVLRAIPSRVSQEFLFWLLSSPDFRKSGEAHMYGAGGQKRVPDDFVREFRSPIPPLPEQKAIARFLDKEVAKIDALVAEQRRLIALLAEKRQAVISHAVTKGLNPATPLKPSGIDWLGDIPEGWEVVPLKVVATVQTGIAKGKDVDPQKRVEVPYLRVANVQDGFLDLTDIAMIEIEFEQVERYLLQPGDVLMNEGGDFDKLGRGAVWSGEVSPCIHQNHVFAVRPSRVAPGWLSTVISSDYAKFYFMTRSKQSTNLASISSTNLMNLPVIVPNEAERFAIIDFLQRQNDAFDSLTAAATSAISLLQERRAALISAAVTGKIDLRPHFAQSLSEPETA